jgi:hypothetical protein
MATTYLRDTIKSFDKVKAKLAEEISAIENRSMAGLIEAAAFIRVDMERTPPLVPVDMGHLRGSWFTSPLKFSKGPVLIIGFSAGYAVFVHEMLDSSRAQKVKWNRPGSGPKFFEYALNRNHEEILKIVADNAKIK